MANMTASTSRRYKGPTYPQVYGCVGYTDYQDSAAEYTIYKGAVVIIDVSDVDGYAQPMQSGITAAAGDVFLGVALEEVEITSSDTAQGDVEVLVARDGVWAFAKASLTVTDIGAPIDATDDQVVATSGGIWIGTLVDVDDTYAWIDIGHAAGHVNSAAA